MVCLMPANSIGGKLSTPTRIAKYVVPQKNDTLAKANHAFLVSLTMYYIRLQK